MLSCLVNLKILVLVKVFITILYCNVTTQQWVKEDSYTAADCILNWLATPAVAPSSAQAHFPVASSQAVSMLDISSSPACHLQWQPHSSHALQRQPITGPRHFIPLTAFRYLVSFSVVHWEGEYCSARMLIFSMLLALISINITQHLLFPVVHGHTGLLPSFRYYIHTHHEAVIVYMSCTNNECRQ